VDNIDSPAAAAWRLFTKQRELEKGPSSAGTDADLYSEFREFQNSNPDAWSVVMEAITQSTINHVTRLKEIGVSGAIVNVINTSSRFGPPDEYCRLSKPYEDQIIRALAETRITILHLQELDRAFLAQPLIMDAPVIYYSASRSGIPISEVRKHFSGTIMGGVDENTYGKLSTSEIRMEWTTAWKEAGWHFIAAPGGPLPAELSVRQIGRLQDSLLA
jgi:uroporphyrinogen-III decarboxylase